MTDLVKKAAPLIWSEIQKSQNILLHCHVNPDGDSYGSALGLFNALPNKKITVISGDNPLDESFSLLPGFQQITPKSFSELNLNEYDLFLILDSSTPNQISDKTVINFPEHLQTIVIDHHAGNINFGKINLVDPTYISCCEIVYNLLKAWKVEITKAVSECLFLGMYTDTGGFKYKGVSSDTFLAASEMIATGAEASRIIFEMENSNDPKSIEYMGLVFSSIEHLFSGQVGLCSISYETFQENQIDPSISVPEMTNKVMSTKYHELAIVMTEKEPNNVRVSMRSKHPEKYSVGKIAIATKFGNGHPVAAGARIKLPFNEAKKLLLETIQQVYPELGNP